MDLSGLFSFLILCHLKPFKTDKLLENLPKYDDIEMEFNIDIEGSPATTATKVFMTSTDSYKKSQVIRVEDLRRLFQKLGVGKQIQTEENSTEIALKTDTTEKITKEAEGRRTSEVLVRMAHEEEENSTTAMAVKTDTTEKITKGAEESDYELVHMKDLRAAINDLEKKLMKRFSILKYDQSSSSANESPGKIYNLMDFIKIGRGENLSHPRTDNLNWLKIKIPFKSLD